MQPLARQVEVDAADLGTEQGGSGFQDMWADLLGGGTISPALRVRDMGPDPPDAKGTGRIPP